MRLLLIDREETAGRADLAAALAGEAPVRILVERRARDRRRRADRRSEAIAPAADARRLRSASGRRVADRRGPQVTVPGPHGVALPPGVRCVDAAPLPPLALEDADSARLVLRMQAGDRDALAALYQRYFDKVYAYVRMALRDDHEAEDATQDVFARALGALPGFEVGSAGCVRGWLFRVARNQVVDRLRRRRAVVLDPDDVTAHLGAGAEHAAPAGFTDEALLAHVKRLPHAQREVLVLRYALDFAGPEIAAVTGRTPAAVRQLHQRAMTALRASVEPPALATA